MRGALSLQTENHLAYEYDPRRRRARRGRVPPQLRAWVFGRRRRASRRRYDPERRRRRRYARRYDPIRRFRRPSLWGLLSKGAGVFAFVEQATEKDRERPDFISGDMGEKAKRLMGYIIARVTGLNISELGVSGIKQTLNISGIFNKWLGIGLGMFFAGMIPFVPFRGKLKSFGKNIAVGGAIGGLFDQPALQTPAYNPALAGAAGVPLIPQQLKRSVWS